MAGAGGLSSASEETGIASDVVKVKGEDPATPGLLPQGIDRGTVTIPQYRYNKTKQHTPHCPVGELLLSSSFSGLCLEKGQAESALVVGIFQNLCKLLAVAGTVTMQRLHFAVNKTSFQNL